MNFINQNVTMVPNTFSTSVVPQGLSLIDSMLNSNLARLSEHTPGSPEHLIISRRIETLNKQRQEVLQAQSNPIQTPSFENFISTPTANLAIQTPNTAPLIAATSNNLNGKPVLSTQEANQLKSYIVATPQSEAEAKRNILISLIL